MYCLPPTTKNVTSTEVKMSNQVTKSRVGICIPSFETGGVQRAMVTVGNELAKRGHSVQLVVGDDSGEQRKNVHEDVEIVDLNARSPPFAATVGLFVPAFRYFSENSPDVFVSSMNHVNVVLLAAWKLASPPSKMVIVEHNDPKAIKRNSLKNSLVYGIASYEYKWADQVVGVSDGVVDSLRDMMDIQPQKLTRIYNPIFVDRIRRRSTETPDHEWFQSDTPVILNVGRLVKQKDQELLLDSFSRLRDRIDAKLIIIGRGGLRNDLLEKADELGVAADVDIIEWVENPYAYMGSADVFALSSLWEGLPTVLIEALSCGCSVVSVDCPSGPREILDGNGYGTLVASRNPEHLADTIYEKLVEPDSEEQLMQGAKRFDVDRSIQQYSELIQEMSR